MTILRPQLVLPAVFIAALQCSIAWSAPIVYGTGETGPSEVFRVTGPTTQTTLASGGSIVNPRDVEIFGLNSLLVSSVNGTTFLNHGSGDGSIVSVDRTTGVQTIIASNNTSTVKAFGEPRYMDFDSSGNIIIADARLNGSSGGIIRVNPTTGQQTIISSGGLFSNLGPVAVAVESTGDFLVTDQIAKDVIRVSADGTTQTVLAADTDSGSFINGPGDIVLDNLGNIFLADVNATDGDIIKIDPNTGGQTLIATGINLSNPRGLDFFNGSLYVADSGRPSQTERIIQVDPLTGAQTLVTSTLGNGRFVGVASIPEPSSSGLLGLMLIGGFGFGWRKRRRQ